MLRLRRNRQSDIQPVYIMVNYTHRAKVKEIFSKFRKQFYCYTIIFYLKLLFSRINTWVTVSENYSKLFECEFVLNLIK